MKKNCEDLREHMIKIIDCEKKEMISLTDVMMLRKLVLIMMIKNIIKSEIITILVNIEVLLIIFVI